MTPRTLTLLRLALSVVALMLVGFAAAAQSFETKARAAYVYDQTTGTVLLAKNADDPLPPASMSKLMTLFMAFEAIRDGRLHVTDELLVSQHAMDYQGSSMFLRSGERVKVEDLLRGIIVLSGNDASAVIAEALSPDGSEAGFARLMTDRARQLGMKNSSFANSNGWPAVGHLMSMRDLGILADHIISEFPTYYPLFSEQEYHFDGRVPSNSQNRNPILALGMGADGLKTGHTSEAGYGLIGSAKQGDRRVIFVISGLDSAEARAEEGERILNWAFRQFAEEELLKAGTRLGEATIWMGDADQVGLTVNEDIKLLVPTFGGAEISAEIVFRSPIEAPVQAGQQMGELVITRPELPEVRVPLVAEADVARGGFAVRLKTAALVLLRKISPSAADTLSAADG